MKNSRIATAALLSSFLGAGIALGSVGVGASGCHATPSQVSVITSAITDELECVANAALNGGLTDATAIATECGGITVSAVVAIVESFLTPDVIDASPEAASTAPPTNATRVASAKKTFIIRIRNFTPDEINVFSALDKAWRAQGLTPQT